MLRFNWAKLLLAGGILCIIAITVFWVTRVRLQNEGNVGEIRHRLEILKNRTGRRPINSHHFPYTSVERTACSSQKVYLLILVSSGINHVDVRRAIRNTWGTRKHLQEHGVLLLFLVGTSPDHDIRDEVASFHDIVQQGFPDAYHNLYLKSIMGLQYSKTYCQDIKYLMKTDDDVYVNIPYLVSFLKRSETPSWMIGCDKQENAPKPHNYSEISLQNPHPRFLAGAGYVISNDLIEPLFEASMYIEPVAVEDAFVTGYLARALGIQPTHVDGFSCGEIVKDDCELVNKMTGHRINPDRMYSIWEKFSSEPNPCMDF